MAIAVDMSDHGCLEEAMPVARHHFLRLLFRQFHQLCRESAVAAVEAEARKDEGKLEDWEAVSSSGSEEEAESRVLASNSTRDGVSFSATSSAMAVFETGVIIGGCSGSCSGQAWKSRKTSSVFLPSVMIIMVSALKAPSSSSSSVFQ